MGSEIIAIAAGVGVAIGLFFFFSRQAKQSKEVGAKILEALGQSESLSLPELVTRLGRPDTFMNRGRVMTVINPMVARGEITQEEPPGTTVKNRLDVLRFRLKP